MLLRLNNAQLASTHIAEDKAGAIKVFEDAVGGGGIWLWVLTFGANAADGKIMGGIRVRRLIKTLRWRRPAPTHLDRP